MITFIHQYHQNYRWSSINHRPFWITNLAWSKESNSCWKTLEVDWVSARWVRKETSHGHKRFIEDSRWSLWTGLAMETSTTIVGISIAVGECRGRAWCFPPLRVRGSLNHNRGSRSPRERERERDHIAEKREHTNKSSLRRCRTHENAGHWWLVVKHTSYCREKWGKPLFALLKLPGCFSVIFL